MKALALTLLALACAGCRTPAPAAKMAAPSPRYEDMNWHVSTRTGYIREFSLFCNGSGRRVAAVEEYSESSWELRRDADWAEVGTFETLPQAMSYAAQKAPSWIDTCEAPQ